MTKQVATNITWHAGSVTRQERQNAVKQKGGTIWLTGLSACGKSTIAVALEQVLIQRGHIAYCLDGDNVRHGLNKNLGFSAEDRAENIRRIGEVAKLFADAGMICITAFISPYQSDRDLARKIAPPGRFIEVYLNTPIEICEQRDPKGLYVKARKGAIKDFTGISAPYEPPQNPELELHTETLDVPECIATILKRLGL